MSGSATLRADARVALLATPDHRLALHSASGAALAGEPDDSVTD